MLISNGEDHRKEKHGLNNVRLEQLSFAWVSVLPHYPFVSPGLVTAAPGQWKDLLAAILLLSAAFLIPVVESVKKHQMKSQLTSSFPLCENYQVRFHLFFAEII